MGPNQTFDICTPKEIINQMKSQPTEQEKIVANYVTHKTLISKRYKQLIHLTINTLATQSKNRQKIYIVLQSRPMDGQKSTGIDAQY